MFIQSLVITSALIAAPQAPTSPRATPETPPPPVAQEPAMRTADSRPGRYLWRMSRS